MIIGRVTMRTIRPPQAEVYAKYKPGSVCPNCGWKFKGWAEIASHWQAGHFDTETDQPMSVPEAAREVVEIHNAIRTMRAGLGNKSNLVEDTFTSLGRALTDIERRLNALAVEVGKLKA